jgi:hypothetical protein
MSFDPTRPPYPPLLGPSENFQSVSVQSMTMAATGYILSVGTPINPYEAANKIYVDEKIGNLVSTNASITNLLATNASATNLLATNASITNLNVSSVTMGNLKITDATLVNLVATNSSILNLTATNETVSNIVATNASILNLNVSNMTYGNLNITNASFTNLIVTNSSIGTLYATHGYIPNFFTATIPADVNSLPNTLSATQILGHYILVNVNGVNDLTLPTATSIVSQIGAWYSGLSFTFSILKNGTGKVNIILAGTGITATPSNLDLSIDPDNIFTYILVLDSVTTGKLYGLNKVHLLL